MTDHRPYPDDDALDRASAYLDAELDPADRVDLETSPELLTLVAELQWVRELVADTPLHAPTGTGRDTAVRAALDVFDREIAPTLSPSADHTTVTRLSTARRWRRHTTVVVAVAASLLLVAIAVGSFGSTMGDDMDMSSDAENAQPRIASQAAAGDGLAESTVAESVDAEGTDVSTVVTIDTIIGPASVPTVIDDPVVLLELAGQVLGQGWITGDPTAITPPPADLDLFGCTPTLSPTQLIIATITFVDQPALAVADLSDSSVAAIDIGCNVIAEAAYAG